MASNFKTWIEHNAKTMSPEQFSSWLDSQPPHYRIVYEQNASIPQAIKDIEKIHNEILKKVVAPALKRAAEFLTKLEKASAPSLTGTLKQSLGPVGKIYPESSTVWAAAGVRRGFGRVIVASRKVGGKPKRTSKKVTQALGSDFKQANPANYAWLVQHGRGPVVAGSNKGKPTGKRALFNSFTGTFFGHSVKGSKANDFMAAAEAQVGAVESIVNDEIDSNLKKLAV